MDTNYPTPNSSPFESHQSPKVRNKTTTNGLAIKKRKKNHTLKCYQKPKKKKNNERSRHKTNEITAPGWCGCWFVRRRNLRPGEFDCGKHRATGKRCSPHAQVHGTAGEPTMLWAWWMRRRSSCQQPMGGKNTRNEM